MERARKLATSNAAAAQWDSPLHCAIGPLHVPIPSQLLTLALEPGEVQALIDRLFACGRRRALSPSARPRHASGRTSVPRLRCRGSATAAAFHDSRFG